MKYFGYAGQILRVDLSRGKIEKEPLSKELIEGYLGGVGMQYVPSIWLQNAERPVILDQSLRGFAKFVSAEGESYLHDHFGRRLSRDDVHKMLDDYYETRGWDIDRGIPTKEKLLGLGLEEFIPVVEEALNK
jgi:aldehyde:ferredoxin oxidoreductase